MAQFRADLHIHSRFSRATSSKLNAPLLAAWARLKGLDVIGSGDFTHPKWREELTSLLRFDEASGLYLLRDPASAVKALPEYPLPDPERVEDAAGRALRPARFMLQGEISSIYKRGGRVRKVHNLVFMPTLEAAEAFSRKLAVSGNLHSDGRPILGLDSRNLLEMVLEAHPQAFLVPAHIWTPWFSLFGSKSGFDALAECFGDLTEEIFALETGLSSDPAMNRLWSELDNCRLISNSDAHSGENLGREATVFAGAVSYQGILNALKHPEKHAETVFLGTLEFFPEEGKYHMDGHRKCNVLLTPEETRKLGGICPVCGSSVTEGVLSRVMALADRKEPLYPRFSDTPGAARRAESVEAGQNSALAGRGEPLETPLGERQFASLVPLPELLSEILGSGPKTRRVTDMYGKLLSRFGSELGILQDVEPAELARFFPPLGEAVARMRKGEVRLRGGYDGEYGTVRVFGDHELSEIQRGAGVSGGRGRTRAQGLSLMGEVVPVSQTGVRKKTVAAKAPFNRAESSEPDGSRAGASAAQADVEIAATADMPDARAKMATAPPAVEDILNPSQERAVAAGPTPVLVLAGPGTGKTRTLIARVKRLVEQGVSPRKILAVTFTRRAAMEMDTRLKEAFAPGVPLPRTDTLHALALELWHRTHENVPVLLSEDNARRVFAEANSDLSAQTLRDAGQAVDLARERLVNPPEEFAQTAQQYIAQKSAWNLADYTDLLEFWLERIRNDLYVPPWTHLLVDEIQDLSPLQLTLVRSLPPPSGEGFFGIGDPDQSIYGFRGAHGRSTDFFREAWPDLSVISLTHNYRSRPGILQAAASALGPSAACSPLVPVRKTPAAIFLFGAPSAESEAVWIAQRASALIGRGSHTLTDMADPGTTHSYLVPSGEYSPGDIAVLVRTRALAGPIRKALARVGVPVTDPAADAFWADPRVALLLREAGRTLGIAVSLEDEDAPSLSCPDRVLVKGPLALSAYLSTFPPFDLLFWQSPAFRALTKAYETNGGWAELITWINLQNELELVRGRSEKVQVLTLHAAKGLEFGVVFMPGLEDGILPFAGPEFLTGKPGPGKPSENDIEEERRLFYVGLTRAKDALFLSLSSKRTLFGRELHLKPSRFLASLPAKGEGAPRRSTLIAKVELKETQLRLL